ncbi:MAG TPA: DNA primase [Gemmataceae bacterium]|nr:DNA primase [Gemmataceae bacterium]
MADDRVSLIKQANDIVDVVGSYVTLRPVGAKFKGLCPFHDDHRPSFDVDPRRQNYRCWSCGKHGDVITFVQEHERVDFREALELLARRAGITLEKRADSPNNQSRALMLDIVCWAAEQYHTCLLDSPLADAARRYLGERKLLGETVRRFGLGYAPASWDWLRLKAEQAGMSAELLQTVGLLLARNEGQGYYDRFRDRVMFPIRDPRGQAVGFGGRILTSSPSADQGGKYINSSGTPLFSKSELLYGLDQARQAAAAAGFLAVVEGYTDVLMAHQMGIANVVATMGTALNARHVRHLRRIAPRVVLVFDADAGGNTGVDRALEIFVGQDVDLAIATLPEGMDPCDLLLQQGPEPFRAALTSAVDALEFKLDQVLTKDASQGIEGRRRAIDSVLGVIALVPEMPGQSIAIKRELAITRISQRLAIKEESLWARLRELHESTQMRERKAPVAAEGQAKAETMVRAAPAPAEERELLELLLANPTLVADAAALITPDQLKHPGLRTLLEGLYALQAEGEPPTLDLLRSRMDNTHLVAKALELQEVGKMQGEPETWLRLLLARFQRKYRFEPEHQELKSQLLTANNHAAALDLLRRLQNPN